MARVVRSVIAVIVVFACWGTVRAATNLCFNGSFDNTNSPLEGWTYDYAWDGNKHYMDNKDRVSVLPDFGGKKNVLFINGTKETKVESKPIPYEPGCYYKCTMNIRSSGRGPHIYFTGYKWDPGVAPHPDPHLGKLRRIYKSEYQAPPVCDSWRTVSFEFPLKDLSKLGMGNLKLVRFFTVYICALEGGTVVYADDVVVTKLQGPPATSTSKPTGTKTECK